MGQFLRFVIPVVLLGLPSRFRIAFLRLLGSKIGVGCRLGFSWYDVAKFELGDEVYIGHLNVFRGVRKVRMGSGSRISNLNWITGGGSGEIVVGVNTSVSSGHYLDCIGSIRIGSNTIIGGRRSSFFSHGIAAYSLDMRSSIEIGDWCYVGSDCKFAPGARLSGHVFVGIGSVVVGSCEEEYVLLAGVPAEVRKRYQMEDVFFARREIVHRHRKK